MTKKPKDEAKTRAEQSKPTLRFTPTAWAKLHYLAHRAEAEVGAFGITAADDLLLVENIVTVKQTVSMASVRFDDEAVADFFDMQVDAGRRPEQFSRIWVHSHPGMSPTPSSTDEETFHRVFGSCDWAVMFILGRGGKTYARLRFNAGPGGSVEIPVQVDFSPEFGPSDQAAWEAEYQAHVQVEHPIALRADPLDDWLQEGAGDRNAAFADDLVVEDLWSLDPEERDQLLAEMGYHLVPDGG